MDCGVRTPFELVVELSAVAATVGPIGWASWRRLALGWRFWMGLGSWGAVLAFASLIGCLMLVLSDSSCPGFKPKRIRFYVCLNIGTLVLSVFVPTIAAV